MQEIRHEQTASHGEMEEPVLAQPCPSAPRFPVLTAPHLPLSQVCILVPSLWTTIGRAACGPCCQPGPLQLTFSCLCKRGRGKPD